MFILSIHCAAGGWQRAMNNEVLLTPVQICERLQIEKDILIRWLQEGYLPGYKFGRIWRIAPNDLESFLERHANRPPDNIASLTPA